MCEIGWVADGAIPLREAIEIPTTVERMVVHVALLAAARG
jgi:hypothetical protein